jgi:NADH-quinone oxidoreductase subunit A
MTKGYVPILILAVLAAAFAILSLAASALLRPRRPVAAKYEPYECGIEPIRLPATEHFPVKFYVVAMLFIIFDIETIFLFPWAVAFRGLGVFGLVEMMVFIGLLFVAYLYVWQKGGLDWNLERAGESSVDRPVFTPLPPEFERGPGEHPTVAQELAVSERAGPLPVTRGA